MLKKLMKKVLPRTIIDLLLIIIGTIDIQLSAVASKSRFLSVVYYSIFSWEFSREMQAVLKAKISYSQSLSGANPTSFLLRRNIHRLEKGLIMRPRRTNFGESYVAETVNHFKLCLEREVLTDSEYEWTVNVLNEYFVSVKSNASIAEARALFESLGTQRQVVNNLPFSSTIK